MKGIVSSGITYYVQGMVMKTRGPVFVTAFNPLCMIIVAALGSAILGEQLHLGRYLDPFPSTIIELTSFLCTTPNKISKFLISKKKWNDGPLAYLILNLLNPPSIIIH